MRVAASTLVCSHSLHILLHFALLSSHPSRLQMVRIEVPNVEVFQEGRRVYFERLHLSLLVRIDSRIE
jgi:hypothetical protein